MSFSLLIKPLMSLLNLLKLSAKGSPHVLSGAYYWARELKQIPTEVVVVCSPQVPSFTGPIDLLIGW